MYFKRLEIIGFKSFPEKTIFNFEPGVTAIVGPNGCGKSNISDSIKWVLGEQSPKALRGTDMEDVIFNGTDSLPPLNLAEVSLTLSNESKRLPIDFEEITITRRLFRSGESEYILNKAPVRLKDIQELLMGTGIGLESYSFIEQGKMDAILSSKPEERRAVFEEASGITKYKAKKREALRKLEQTEENLLRLGDIIQEVKRQLDFVERQAKKAKRYQEEFERLKDMELKLASAEYYRIEKEKDAVNCELLGVTNKRAEDESSLAHIGRMLSEVRNNLNGLMESLKDKTAQSVKVSANIESNNLQITTNDNWIKQLKVQESNILSEIELLKSKIVQLEKTLSHTQENRTRICDEDLKQKTEVLQKNESSLLTIDTAINQLNGSIKSSKTSLIEHAARQSHIKNEASNIHASVAGVVARIKRLKTERGKVGQELLEMESRFSDSAQLQSKAFPDGIKTTIDKNVDAFLGNIDRFVEIKNDTRPGLRAFLSEWAQNLISETLNIFGLENKPLQQQMEKLKEELSLVDFEEAEANEEQNSLNLKLSDLNSQGELLQKEYADIDSSIVLSQQRIERLLKEREAVVIEKTRLFVELESLKDKGLDQSEQITALQENLRLERLNLASKYNQLEEGKNRQVEITSQIDFLNQQISDFIRHKEEQDESIAEFEREKTKISESLVMLEERQRSVGQNIDTLSNKISELEAKILDFTYKQKAIADRLFVEYKVDIAQVTREDAQTDGIEPASLQTEIAGLKEKLERLGPVNLTAIEEQKELGQRRTFLTAQQEDLLKAKESLKEAIGKINKTTRSLFAETFDKVRNEFQHFFRLLFGGGEADLILLDESDILECGIEIIARPLGKRAQNVGLLSGGEKALVAIALLFGLFKVNPSPFCVLDEIDAPLDESNIGRFINALDEFVQLSQFIVITHSKKTITKADVMYGITMEEAGVSKVVSVKLKEKEAETVTA